METERIERKGFLGYGFSCYIQEINKPLISTEKIKVYIHNPILMPEKTCQKVNILV